MIEFDHLTACFIDVNNYHVLKSSSSNLEKYYSCAQACTPRVY